MRKIGSLIIIILVVFISGCQKKEFPAETVSDPVFKIDGSIDGQVLTMSSGLDGYFLFTDFEETLPGNFELITSLAPYDCDFCGPSLHFFLNTNTSDWNDEAFDIGQLGPGSLEYTQEPDSPDDALGFIYFDEFENLEDGIILNIGGEDLDFDDGFAVFDLDFPDIISFIYIDPGGGEVFCTSELIFDSWIDPCGWEDAFEISSYGFESHGDGLVTFYPPETSEQTFVMWHVDGSDTPFHISESDEPFDWFFEDEIVNITAFVGGDFWPPSGYENTQLVNPLAEYECEPLHLILGSVPDDTEAEPTIEVVYIDENGEFYSSYPGCFMWAEQPESSYFNVNSVEDFDPNNTGQSTVRLSIDASCHLFLEDSDPADPDFITLESLEGSIGFAYPQ
jgi:hypothetical protein